jgi:hypothetical protein
MAFIFEFIKFFESLLVWFRILNELIFWDLFAKLDSLLLFLLLFLFFIGQRRLLDYVLSVSSPFSRSNGELRDHSSTKH